MIELARSPIKPNKLSLNSIPERPGAYEFQNHWILRTMSSLEVIDSSYFWFDSLLLTKDDFALIDRDRAGPHRSEGREFVAASVLRPMRHLTLTVTFPVGYYPQLKSVRAYYEDRSQANADPVADAALQERLQFTGQSIVLSLPYPLMGYRYTIAWCPVALPPTESTLAVRDRARQLGDQLAQSFLDGLRGTSLADLASVAIYVPDPSDDRRSRFLDRVGFVHGTGALASPEAPPTLLDLKKDKGLFTRDGATWGSLSRGQAIPNRSASRREKRGCWRPRP